MHPRKTLGIPSVVLAGALTLTGCGTDTNTDNNTDSATKAGAGASVSTQHNQADTAFAQAMIPHHGQAIDMAKMARSGASRAEVKKLAADIEAAQRPEITKMTGWLKAWEEDVPSTKAGMSGMDHGSNDHSMPGMMTTAQMNQLGKARGASFDRMFLQMMIKHHQGALEMARTEKAEGKNDQAVKLAASIEASQTAEIAKMRQMLNA